MSESESYNSNCIADLCDIIMLLCISQCNLIKFKLYELLLMLSKTTIKIMNAFHPWAVGYIFFQ